jgi:hypothetical protein
MVVYKVVDGYTRKVYSIHRVKARAVIAANRINHFHFTYCIIVSN